MMLCRWANWSNHSRVELQRKSGLARLLNDKKNVPSHIDSDLPPNDNNSTNLAFPNPPTSIYR